MTRGFTLIEALAATILLSLLAQAVIVSIRMANRASVHQDLPVEAYAVHPDRLTEEQPASNGIRSSRITSEETAANRPQPSIEWLSVTTDDGPSVMRLRTKSP
jgi:Tfp pilus assembly protein PilE